MSRTIVFRRYGGPEVLEMVDVPPPAPGPGQVRVAVKAAGVQPFDCMFRSGTVQQWVPARFPQRLGNEAAGVIDAVGDGVTEFVVGDEVLGWSLLGGYAEHTVVGAQHIVRKPASMPWTEAGVLSASGQTASTALEQLGVRAGDIVLIHAAAGGVGSFAVQLARAMGATTVIGTSSEPNHDYLRSLGALPVAYGEGLARRVRQLAPGGVTAALVAAGTEEALLVSLELVSDKNRVGTITYQPLAKQLEIRRLSTERSVARLTALVRQSSEGCLRVVLQQQYPLGDATEAHRVMETGHVRGKIVLVC